MSRELHHAERHVSTNRSFNPISQMIAPMLSKTIHYKGRWKWHPPDSSIHLMNHSQSTGQTYQSVTRRRKPLEGSPEIISGIMRPTSQMTDPCMRRRTRLIHQSESAESRLKSPSSVYNIIQLNSNHNIKTHTNYQHLLQKANLSNVFFHIFILKWTFKGWVLWILFVHV